MDSDYIKADGVYNELMEQFLFRAAICSVIEQVLRNERGEYEVLNYQPVTFAIKQALGRINQNGY